MTLPDRVIDALDTALAENLPPEVPGAAVAILTPEGEWFGAAGLSDLENNVALAPDDRFEAGSITKTFVATTLLQLVEENQLELDDTLTEWLPPTITDLVPNASDITIEQILGHTSGIADYLDGLTAQATLNPTLFLQQWEPEQLISFIDGVDPLFDPGTSWEYSNTNYILAGEVIEAVTGNSYGQEIRDRILDPVGLDNTFVFGEEDIPGDYIRGYWDFNGDGTLDNLRVTDLSWTGSAGSIISNTEDLADFFEALLVDQTLLQDETLDEMLDTIPVNSPNYDSYGLGIGTLESRNRFWYVHRGQTLAFRSNLWYSPLEDITYVELLNGRSSSNLVSDLLPTYRRTIQPPTPDIITYDFSWTGQIAGFSVEGEFSYDLNQSYEDGIVREENLESFDITFFDPAGNLLRTYEDNHLTFPEFNFAFDTNTQEILQDGFFLGSDGFNFGEKTAVGDGFTGLNFWSRPEFNSQGEVPPPHLHIDDWADEFGFPLGFSSHEDVAFFTRTTADLIATGRTGDAYVDNPVAGLDEFGDRIVVSVPANQDGTFEVEAGVTSLFLNFSLFESAGLVIQDATPTATPFSNEFQLAFEVSGADFSFESVPFAPLGGSIFHTGDITFLVGGDTLLTIGDFSVGFDASRVSDTTSGFFVADTLEDGLGIDVLFDVSNPDRLIVADDELTIADADLLLAPELAEILGINDAIGADVGDVRIDAALMDISDPPPPPPTDTPVISISVEPSVVAEEGDTTFFEFILNVDGEIPPPEFDADGNLISGGLPFFFDSSVGAIFEEIEGGPIINGFTFGSVTTETGGLEFILLEDGATSGFNIFNDLIEEEEQFTFSIFNDDEGLLNSNYTVNPEASSATVTIIDNNGGPGVGPTVSLSVSESNLVEGDRFTVNFDVEGDLPEGGLDVLVTSDMEGAIGEFVIFDENNNLAVETNGIAGVPIAGDGTGSSFVVTLVAPEASLTLDVFDDGPGEGLESIVFEVANGELYEITELTSAVELMIDDATSVPPPEAVVTVDFSTTTFIEELGTPFPGEVENPQTLTVTFTVEGELPDGVSPVVNFASSEPDGLTRFSLTEAQTDGLIAVADVINFEFTDAQITLLEPTSSLTLPVFNLPDDRDLDSDGIIEDFAGQTEMVDFTITSLTDGVTINPDTQVITGTFFETIADASPTPSASIDFESGSAGALSAGDVVTNQIDGLSIEAADDLAVMIFDSENPTGGDKDLASSTLGNVLIISEDGDSADPDDNAKGGTLMFDWDGTVSVASLGLLDIEETGGSVTLYSSDDTTVLATIDIPGLGDNSIQSLDIGTADVGKMDVFLVGSGAITEIILAEDSSIA